MLPVWLALLDLEGRGCTNGAHKGLLKSCHTFQPMAVLTCSGIKVRTTCQRSM